MAPSLPQRPTLDRLSYSAWRSGRACPLRLAYDRDPTYQSWRRATPASALGTVRHRLEEEVESGAADRSPLPAEEWFVQRWSALIATAVQEMDRQWAPAKVARPESWDGYFATSAALRKRLGALIDERRRTPGIAALVSPSETREPLADTAVVRPLGIALEAVDASGDPISRAPRQNPAEPPQPGAPYVEVTLIDADRRLMGRLDHVEARDAGVAVIDFKSLGGGSEGQLPEEVRTQLLFYAGLVEAAWGVWPMLVVSRPGRQEDLAAYTPAEAIAVRTEAVAFLAGWNAGGALAGVEPGAERCRWCLYQAICPAFRDSFPEKLNADPRGTRAHSLAAGRVLALERQGGRELRVTIAQEQALTCPAGETTIARLPGSLELEVGDWIAVARLDRGGGTSTVRGMWNSLIYVVRVN